MNKTVFKSARFKITVWYVIAIMLISLIFSIVIFKAVSSDLNQRYINIENQLRKNIKSLDRIPPVLKIIIINDLRVARQRVLFILLLANGGIFVLSLFIGYFLSGRTLRPIEDMVKEQNRFVSDASHELRTPLSALKTSTEVALRDKKMSVPDARHILEENLDDIESLETLSENLLRLAQYQEGSRILALQKINIGDVARKVMKKIKVISEKKKIDIKSSIDDVYIKADPISMEELLFILLDNAIKYTAVEGRVSLNIASEGRYAVLSISDSGKGIDPVDMPHIFERFYRADLSRSKNKVSGYGLGLPVAREIVKLHNGTIGVSSKAEQGSTFTVKIPSVK